MCFFDVNSTFFDPFDYATLVVFWLDIIFSFRTTYFNQNNEEVVDGIACMKNYATSSHIWIDILSAIPLKLFFNDAA
jgi:hypothetical protein